MKEVYSPFKKKTASKILSLLAEWGLIRKERTKEIVIRTYRVHRANITLTQKEVC